MPRVCPKCRAEYGADDVFCEEDGARLVDGAAVLSARDSLEPPTTESPSLHDAETPLAPAVAPRDCPSCGVIDADDGDGYCKACGHRLAPKPPPQPHPGTRSVSTSRPTPPLIPIGARLGGSEIMAPRANDDFVARAENGATVTVTIGDPAALAEEAAALESLLKSGEGRVPHAVEQGTDTSYGAYLVLTAPPAGTKALLDEGPAMSLDEVFGYLRALLDLAEAVERTGRGWAPDRADLYVAPGGAPFVARLRVQEHNGRLDARALLEAAGGAFTPYPAVNGSMRLVRALLSHRGVVTDETRSIADMRAELAAAEKEGRAEANDPRLGGVCDVGMRRDHNEDAMALASGETRGEKWAVLVVCDGVSSSTHAEQASTLAAKTACDALAHFARSGDIAYEAASTAMAAAIRAAHLAVCAQGIEHGVLDPPGTTIVAGLVYRRRLTVGWVGDSRAYWITPHGAELLSKDHSWANEAVSRGEMTEEEAMLAPLAHALTRCLGPLEVGEAATRIPEVEPDVRARDLPGPGHVVLCSDGLWNYFPSAADLAALVRIAGPRATPDELARTLVNHALVKGGMDNTTVAIYAFG
jgi:PPM family protein phosphatase